MWIYIIWQSNRHDLSVSFLMTITKLVGATGNILSVCTYLIYFKITIVRVHILLYYNVTRLKEPHLYYITAKQTYINMKIIHTNC